MRKLFAILCILTVLLSCVMPAFAAEGRVVYSGNSGKFIFAPGSDYSPTDLFPNFKDVMPGDTIEQRIVVRNEAANNCKVKIYMRALGAHEDSTEFLSQLKLTVQKGSDTIMFDAAADQTAQLTDWVCLGTLYSGGECELIVTLEVPVTLDNRFKNLVGYLDWEFAVEELPIEEKDPDSPQTGDTSGIFLWIGVMAGSAAVLIILLILRKKKNEKD